MKATVLLFAAVVFGAALAEDGARYLIITPDAFYSSIQPLARWKQACGMSCKVVRLSEVGYDTTAIRRYIRTAYGTWPVRPEYVLLVGAASVMPARQYRYENYVVSSDNAYADLDDSLPAELPVGRLPATTTAMLDAMVAKTLDYEQTPDLTDSLWMRRLTVIVRDINDPDDSVYWENVHRAVQCAEAAGFVNVDSISSLRGGTAGDIINSVNRGTGIVLYRGAANGTWHYPFSVQPSLVTLERRLPIVLSITCATMTLVPYEEMLGDSWMRTGSAAAPRGAVAFFGNTHSASDVAAVRSAVCRGMLDGVFGEGIYKLGKACLRAKQQLLTEFPSRISDYRGFNLLGDPDLSIWTATPRLPSVSHPQTIRPGAQQFLVTVANGLTPIANALVCVSMDSTVYAYSYTGAQGTVALDISPVDTGEMRLVVTGNNLYPYDTQVAVALTDIDDRSSASPKGALVVEPTLFAPGTRISCSVPNTSSLAIYSASGRLELKAGATDTPLFWDGRDQQGRRCEPGVYLCVATDASGRILASAKLVRMR